MTIHYNGPAEITALIDKWNDEMKCVIRDQTGIQNIKNDLSCKIDEYTQSQLAKAEEKLRIAVEALEFYASSNVHSEYIEAFAGTAIEADYGMRANSALQRIAALEQIEQQEKENV